MAGSVKCASGFFLGDLYKDTPTREPSLKIEEEDIFAVLYKPMYRSLNLQKKVLLKEFYKQVSKHENDQIAKCATVGIEALNLVIGDELVDDPISIQTAPTAQKNSALSCKQSPNSLLQAISST
jgi:hypothetical protein